MALTFSADPRVEPVPMDRRRGLGVEVLIVLGLSLGASAISSLLSITERLTRGVALAEQSSALNSAQVPDRPWLDTAYQLFYYGRAIVPVLLVLYLLSRILPPLDRPDFSSARFLGFDWQARRFDVLWGVGLAAAIGIPGLGLYAVARALGINTQVAAANLTDSWVTIPLLVLSAIQNSVLEEVIVVGYLMTRLQQVGWKVPAVIIASALLRGSYHLYQGFGGFIGNAVMGVVFALVYLRWRRVGPLVVAHTILDVVAFVGYALARDHLAFLQ